MKVSKLHFSFFLLLFTCSVSFGQSWEWAKAGINNTSTTLCDPYSIATDNKGNIFETGEFLGSITYGPDTFTYMGIAADAFLVKYDSNGNVLWANIAQVASRKCFSNSNFVATDNNGNSYITGSFTDTVTFGTFTLITKGGEVFLVKFAPDGNVLWAKCGKEISGIGYGDGLSVTTDKANNIYMCGEFSDTISFGSYSVVSNSSSSDVFLVKYDTGGNVLWLQSGNTISSGSSGMGNSVTSDSNKNVYITGTFIDTISFGTYMLTTYSTLGSVFIVKYDSNGNVQWAKSSIVPNLGFNPINDECYSVVTDKANCAYITGEFIDTITFGSYELVTKGNPYDVFFVKYDAMGNVVWAQSGELTGASPRGIGYSLSADKWNHIYLAGAFEDTVAFGLVKLFSDHALPSCIFMFDTSGKSLCGTVIDNENDDANAIAANLLASNVYFGADIENDVCIFGNDTLMEITHEFSFLAKWQPCNNNEASVNPVTEKSSLNLFPNPNNGTFTISFSHSELASESQTIEVYNVLGEKVFTETLRSAQNDNTINLTGQASGVYLYRIVDENGELIGEGKFIIE